MKEKLVRLGKYAVNCVLVMAIAFTLSILLNSVKAAVVEWNEPTCADPKVCNVSSLVDTSDLMQVKTGQLNLIGNDLDPSLEHSNQLSVYAESADSAIYAEQNGTGYAIYASGKVGVSNQICLAGNCITAWPAGGGGGDITAVNQGEGTKGGGTSGDVTIEFDCSDVDGYGIVCDGEDIEVDPEIIQNRVVNACGSGSAIRQIFQNGTIACETVGGGGGSGDITEVNSGEGTKGGATSGSATIEFDCSEVASTGLTCSGEDILANTTYLQRRVSSCPANSSIRVINEDGTVTCETDDSGSGGIGGSGTVNYIPKFTAASTVANSSIIESGGLVGIGTSPSSDRLNVGGSVSISSSLGVGANLNFTNSGRTLYMAPSGGEGDIRRVDDISGYNDLRLFGNESGGPDIVIDASGSVGIGKNPVFKFDVAGEIRAEAGIRFTSPGSSWSGNGQEFECPTGQYVCGFKFVKNGNMKLKCCQFY